VRAGIEEKVLYEDRSFPERTRLERWASGASAGARTWLNGVEIFVLDGDLVSGRERFERGTWMRLPPGDSLAASTESGCTLYVKEGAVAWLRTEAGDGR
jgi:hypothetical protein